MDALKASLAKRGTSTAEKTAKNHVSNLLGKLGVEAVAVYSDADANARHVHACDEAVHIGGSAPRDIASAVDSLDSVSRTISSDSRVLQDFLRSFASSADVLAENKEGLQSLLLSLDRFSNISAQLLRQTERGVNEQLQDLRPILRTVIGDSDRIRRTLQTLATFSEYWPESMPGNYLQLDVCQAAPDSYNQGTTCPQSVQNDDPGKTGSQQAPSEEVDSANTVEYILRLPLVGVDS